MLQDACALELAKASVNETPDIQGHREALAYGAEACTEGVKAQIDARDCTFEEPGSPRG